MDKEQKIKELVEQLFSDSYGQIVINISPEGKVKLVRSAVTRLVLDRPKEKQYTDIS